MTTVRELTTTTGNGTVLTLAGAPAGYDPFARLGNGVLCRYRLEDANGSSFERGLGTVANGTLTRSTIYESTNNNNRINLTTGPHHVFQADNIDMFTSMMISVAQYGAIGDGVTDDTVAINNAIAAVASDRGQVLMFEPGIYLVPNGITESKTGLVCVGMGHISTGPGQQQLSMGVHIKTTTAAAWCWTKTPGASGNEYRGGRMENIGFLGNAVTAGGMLNKCCQSIIANCVAMGHTTGVGFKGTAPVAPGDSATLNRYRECVTVDCLVGYQWGDSSDFAGSRAVYTDMQNCIAVKYTVGGIVHTGQGVVNWDDGTTIIGGHFEGHNTGILCNQNLGIRIIGPRFEDNSAWDVNFNRATGGSGTRNLLVAATSQINIGASNVGDVIVGGNSAAITDAGDTTQIFGSHEATKIQRTSGTPTGGFSGEIRVGSAKIWVNDAGTWKSVAVS